MPAAGSAAPGWSKTTTYFDWCERNVFSAAWVYGTCFSLHFIIPVRVKERTQQGDWQEREQTKIAVPYMERGRGDGRSPHVCTPGCLSVPSVESA
jgi:hypothetical protein